MALVQSNTKEKNRIAPHFSLPGVDGVMYGSSDYSTKKGFAVIFTCNHCPCAIASRPVIIDLQKKYPDIGFICINSNDAEQYPEDSYTNMQNLSKEMNFSFPYVYDKSQSVAKLYDAQCTPDNYLFKNTGESFELFFHGRLNDNRKDPSSVTEKDFEENIIKLLAGEEADGIQIPSIGCSIKRINESE